MEKYNIEVEKERTSEVRLNKRTRNLIKAFGKNEIVSVTNGLKVILWRVKDRKKLSELYDAYVKNLNKERGCEIVQTSYEKLFKIRINRKTKIKIYRQVWIGNHCIDLFIPCVGIRNSDFKRGYCLKGIAIEIDGPIHRTYFKQKKDDYKNASLSELGILVWRVENLDTHKAGIIDFKNDQRIGRLSSNARARLWQRIQMLTLLQHASDKDLLSLFQDKNVEKLKEKGWPA